MIGSIRSRNERTNWIFIFFLTPKREIHKTLAIYVDRFLPVQSLIATGKKIMPGDPIVLIENSLTL